MTVFFPKILDLSHHNCGPSGDPDDPIDFAAVAAFGVKGIIHKSSQGVSVLDRKYAERRQKALSAGLLWGAYHFCTGDDADAQVKHFLQAAQPDDTTLMALDHEPNNGDQLDLAGIRAACESLRDQRRGIMPKLYSGNLIKEQTNADDSQNDFFGDVPLWLCQYGPVAKLPDPWSNYWLWQFAGDSTNNHGINIPGIFRGGSVDMNYFAGTDDELRDQWAR